MKAWVRQKAAEVKRKGKNKATWYVHWREPDGTRKARSCGAGTRGKKEAEKLAAQIHSDLVSGTYTGDPSLVLWSTFVKEFARVEMRKMGARHAVSVQATIDAFQRHMNPRNVSQVTTKYINEFIGKRSRDRGRKAKSKLSPATVNRDLRNLKLVLKVAVEWGQLATLPKIRMLKTPHRIRRHVTAEHFAAMYEAAKNMTVPQIPNSTAGEYWRALISFAYITGWRLNEILNIRRDDVDFETGQIRARWEDSKGKRDEVIFVPVALTQTLEPVWRNFGDRPLEWMGSRRTIYYPFTQLQELAGINLPCDEDHEHTAACHVYGFHDFRRAFATNNAATMSSEALQRMMKHSDFATTQSYINYAKLMEDRPAVYVPDVLNQQSGNGGR